MSELKTNRTFPEMEISEVDPELLTFGVSVIFMKDIATKQFHADNKKELWEIIEFLMSLYASQPREVK